MLSKYDNSSQNDYYLEAGDEYTIPQDIATTNSGVTPDPKNISEIKIETCSGFKTSFFTKTYVAADDDIKVT